MTGRRSHGRLSALNGVVHQGNLAIATALTLSLLFHLPLRQTEGVLTSIFGMLGVDLTAPDHTTLSRRGQHIHLIVDSTGRSIVGEGEWAAVKHGGRGHRGWKTLHLAVDRVGVIVAHALTEQTVDDATIGIDLMETISILRRNRLPPSRPPTKSGARAGGGRFSYGSP